jgi:hypothetical protein
MDKDGLPEPPIELRGFKTCAEGDRREVQPGEEYCVQHGGKPLTLDGLRRSAHRTIRMAIHQMMTCGNCVGVPLNEIRCSKCAWMRGAAMGIAGEAEQLGWADDMEPYMKMIGNLEPGWQKRAFK